MQKKKTKTNPKHSSHVSPPLIGIKIITTDYLKVFSGVWICVSTYINYILPYFTVIFFKKFMLFRSI